MYLNVFGKLLSPPIDLGAAGSRDFASIPTYALVKVVAGRVQASDIQMHPLRIFQEMWIFMGELATLVLHTCTILTRTYSCSLIDPFSA